MMILVAALMSVTAVTQAARPRGVRPELGSMYNPSSDFKCFDASNVIPFSQVNDDYCDCEVRRGKYTESILSPAFFQDGSDEPGTSACTNGKFYCENSGHRAQLLLSSRVGDR